MKRLYSVLFLTLILLLAVSCSKDTAGDKKGEENNPEVPNKKDKYPGLSVSTSGQLLLNEKPYLGIGVNYFNAFVRTLEDGQTNDRSYVAGFAYLKERNIPFIRFSLNGFWPKNWDLYLKNKNQYLRNLDAFVKAAEDAGIGLIPSFFWHTPTVPDLVGETVNQWGNAKSKTNELMRSFVKEILVRYRDSPAIWGWEQGNEVNLSVDLPGDNDNLPPIVPALGTPSSRSKLDKLSTNDLVVMMKEFAKEIRKYDGTRIIVSGNAVPRPAAWNLLNTKTWNADTKEQFTNIIGIQNPDPINVLSMHAYVATPDEGYFSGAKVNFDGLIKASMQAASSFMKPLFLGEWGAQQAIYKDQTKTKYLEILTGIETNKVPLSAMWVFDYPPHDVEGEINVGPNNGPREYMLQEIKAANARMGK